MRLAFIGGGNMGEAMMAAVISKEVSAARAISVSDVNEVRRGYLNNKYGVAVTEKVHSACESDVIVLAVKPQQLPGVMRDLSGQLKEPQLVISIVAGVTIDTLRNGLGYNRIVRAMPNTPAQIGAGISIWTATCDVSEVDKSRAGSILGSMGKEIYVNEECYLDMATAVSGSGPAYVFLFVESLITAATDLGLPDKMARELVTETVSGSTRFMQISDIPPADLRRKVTSPGGTTAAALACLEKGGFNVLIKKAVRSAYDRAKELGKS